MTLDAEALANKSSSEIGNEIDELERKLQAANSNYSMVADEDARLRKAILELEIKRSDNRIVMRKAAEIVKRLQSDIRILKNAFWNAKNAGL